MRRVHRPFIALITALLLVFAQQTALAHMIGHTGAAAQSSIQQNEDNHGAALGLSHTCTTCLAFSALDHLASGTDWQLPTTITETTPIAVAVIVHSGTRPLTARARAPPLPL
ncbi:MAG TPA: hypothetical protein VGK09_04420 [Rhodocyclaceae bacterium]|jgi:hypothetical protein